MAAGVALCIERLAPREQGPRFIGCTALPQGADGLGLGSDGQPRWQTGPAVCRLSLNEDGQLQAEQLEIGVVTELHRSGRARPLAVGEPVRILNGDQLWLGGVKLRVHIHGATTRISSPRPISAAELGAEDEPEPTPPEPGALPVLPHPPVVMRPTDLPVPPPPEPPPLEVRDHPPRVNLGAGLRTGQPRAWLVVLAIIVVSLVNFLLLGLVLWLK